jgi:hypothetical protein
VLGLDDGISGMIMVNAFSELKITYIEDTRKVLYRSGMTHGQNKNNFEIFTAEQFIAAITQHIPEKHFQIVRTYGWYSSRSRGERNKPVLSLSKGPDSSGREISRRLRQRLPR